MSIFQNLSQRKLALVLAGLGDTDRRTAADWLSGKRDMRPGCDERLTRAAKEIGVDVTKYRPHAPRV